EAALVLGSAALDLLLRELEALAGERDHAAVVGEVVEHPLEGGVMPLLDVQPGGELVDVQRPLLGREEVDYGVSSRQGGGRHGLVRVLRGGAGVSHRWNDPTART